MNTENDRHFVSVIIPTIKRESLSVVIEALNKQTREPDEIIVMEDKNRAGVSIMINEGIEKSKGDLIAILGDDNVPDKCWLETFINEIDKHQADGISSNYVEEDPLLYDIRLRRKFPLETVVNPDGFFGTGGNCMFRKDCLDECKRLDKFIYNPKLKIGEDVEFAWRLRSRGLKLVYVINYVKHLKRLGPVEFIVFQFHRGKGIGELYILKDTYKNIGLGRGLLWDNYAQKNPAKKWFNAFWHKILGPFDYKSFSKFRYFILFWIGEKAKALGFLFVLLIAKVTGRNPSDRLR